MKKYFGLLLILCLFQNAIAADNPSGIKFRNITLAEAVVAAKQEHKFIFMHGFADWCQHCKLMSDSVYTNPEVGKFYNDNFICLHYDFEKEGKDIASKLKVTSYPVLIYFDETGAIVHRAKGERKVGEFIQLGKDAMDPNKQLRTYETKFNNGTATFPEVYEYFRLLDRAGVDNQAKVNKYLSQFTVDQLTEYQNWRIIADFLRDPFIPATKTFIANKKAFEKKYTTDSVNIRITGIYMTELMKRVQRVDSIGYLTLKRDIKASGLDIADKICAYADLTTFRLKSQYKEFMDASPAFVKQYAMDDAKKLNEIAQQFAERCNDNAQLEMAEGWAKRSVEINDSYKNNMTLVSLQVKLSKKDDAKKNAQHALEVGQKQGADTKSAALILDRLENTN